MTDPNKPSPPNLDLIRQVQRARMLHDAQATPSVVDAGYWLECKPAQETCQPTVRAGGWVIPTTRNRADADWDRIKAATQDGQLGYKSKISTMPGPGQAETDARVIIVRTCDADDLTDVERVRAALIALGLLPAHYERN